MSPPTLKQKLGCWLHERWQAELVLRTPGLARRLGWTWLDLCNRNERLARGEDGARTCLWEDSSLLTVGRVFPRVGGRILRHCLQKWPVRLTEPADGTPQEAPGISVILPVGGADRVALFLCVVRALFGQTFRELEIIAVEHGQRPEYERLCPGSVRYSFIERRPGQHFNKSLVMNAGVRQARGRYVLLHDADIVPPMSYVESIVTKLEEGWDAVRPLRLIFHLERTGSQAFVASDGQEATIAVRTIQQNNPGMSTALTVDAYERIGGHDERFWGWGGEDTEFLDRLKTTRLFPGSYAPAIHLWHPAAPKKSSGDRNSRLFEELMKTSGAERSRRLREHQSIHGRGG